MSRVVFVVFGLLGLSQGNNYPAWKAMGPWGGAARAIRIDEKNPDTLMAVAMRGTGVFRSHDGAKSWIETGFPRLQNARLDAGIIVHNPARQWIVGAAPGGIWKSGDEGDTWTRVASTSFSVFALTAWKKDERVIAAGTDQGVWISHDAGTAWRRISPAGNPDLGAIVSVAFDPKNAAILYAGTPHLPWKTTDGGKTWRKIHVGMFDDSDIFSIAVDPGLSTRVFASACSGIYCSLNSGGAWRRVQGIPGTNRRTYVVAQSPHRPDILFAGTSAGLWTSRNGGMAWSKLNEYVATGIAFHPQDPDLFYISTERHGLLRSPDLGRSFVAANEGFVSRSLSAVVSSADTLTVTAPDEGVFRKTAGSDWVLSKKPEAAKQPPLRPGAFDTAVNPFNASEMLEASRDGLAKSTDGGKTWRQVNGGLGTEWIGGVTYDTKRKDRCFALRQQRVFWSRDGGEHWYWLAAREDSHTVFQKLHISAALPDMLLAVSADRGIFGFSLKENPLE